MTMFVRFCRYAAGVGVFAFASILAADPAPLAESRPGAVTQSPKLIIKDFDTEALFTPEELDAARRRLNRRQIGTELFYAFMFNQTDRVNVLLAQLAQVAPESEDYQYYQALREFRLGQRGQAIAHLQSAVRINPRYDPAWNLIGLIYTQADRNQDAREAFQKAVDAAPYEPAYMYNLAAALVKEGRPADALKYTERSIELKGNFSDAYHLQAKILRDGSDYAKALNAFEKANYYGVESPEFFLDWLRVAHRAEDYKRALGLCERLGDSNSEVVRIHADIRLKVAEFNRAVPLLAGLVARPDVTPQDRKLYIYALFKARQNPYVGLTAMKVRSPEREELLAYIKDLQTQGKETPVVRDPILSPPQ